LERSLLSIPLNTPKKLVIRGAKIMKLYFYVSVLYTIVNPVLAGLVLIKARRNVLSQFYAFCVLAMGFLGVTWFLQTGSLGGMITLVLRQTSGFIYALFPFFFLHFMLVFLRRYEIANSRKIILATYFVGFFCYVLVLLKLIPLPSSTLAGVTPTAYVYFTTWMSMLFAIGVALLYSLIGGFSERGMQSNLLFIAVALLMLLLPTPFTLSIFSAVSDDSNVMYFASSMMSLAIIVFLVFRHRITMNTPYQAMKSALTAMNDIILKTDIDFNIDLVQGAVMSLLGYDERQLLGKKLTDFIHQRDALQEYRTLVLQDKRKESFFDADFVCSDGRALPMEFSLTPVYGNEEVVGFVGVGRNISERKRAEQALGQSEARYRLLFENNPSPMWVYDLSTHQFLLVNTAAVRHYGYTAAQFNGMRVDDITTPNELLSGGIHHSTHRKQDGTTFEAETVSHDITFGDHSARLVLVNDITERKRTEKAVQLSEEKYRRFFQDDLTGYMCCTANGRVEECNPAFVHMLGFGSTEEAIGSNVRALYPSAKAYEAMMRQVRQKGRLSNHEGQLIRIDGKPIYVIENVIGSFSPGGELTGLRTYIFDITERNRLEDELRHAQKMENLGSLAGGIAHDFNNILAIISVHTSLLSRTKPQDEKTARSVEALRDAGKRGAGLASQLLTFARKQDVNFEPVNLNVVLEDLVKLLGPTFPKTILIKLNLQPDLPNILADISQLHQVLMNLCVNARDAMVSGGELGLSTRMLKRDEVRKKFHDAVDEEYVCVAVTDTGSGMDKATRSRIFEPFFTTKGVGKGTGLGLAVVYGIVKSHQGYIDVESEPEKGTTFQIYFRAQLPLQKPGDQELQMPDEVIGGCETILFVEDEDMLMVPLRDLLEEYGYRVLVAQDGVEAVAMFSRHKDTINIILSDIGLPKQNGWEAFLQMREIKPNIKAILASGNFDLSKKEEMLDHGVSQFIQKPYVLEEVLRGVRSVLDSQQTVQAR
jgi:two-component system cell cycle sensor histidine kinase/response regulator CckA